MLAFFVSLGLAWLLILFLDTLFKTCMLHPYIRLIERLGLQIKPLAIIWSTAQFNRFMNRMSDNYHRFLKVWFGIGTLVTIFTYVPCVLLFSYTIFELLWSQLFNQKIYDSELLLIPLIPGINLPASKIPMYFVVTLISSIVHELGHALAASRERISMELCGFSVYAIFPVAFVNVRLEEFINISKWQQMRILCAGIWHNIVMALLACLTLLMLAPIMSPLYYSGIGVSVLKVHEQSGLNTLSGLAAGDHIYKVGDCDVKDVDSWFECLEKARVPAGLCIPSPLLRDFNRKEMLNCSSSLDSLYFEMTHDVEPSGVCLKARAAINNFKSCYHVNPNCKMDSLCSYPVLQNSHIFTSITRTDKPLVLFVGSINELNADVTVSAFVPKFKSAPAIYAEYVKEFFGYILMFSCGLAFFNLVPGFNLDGELIVETLIHICFSDTMPVFEHRRYLFRCIKKGAFFFVSVYVCTILLVLSRDYFA